LFGPILESLANPLALLKKIASDRFYFQTWVDDLRYYHACDLFNGRKPPIFERLATWRVTADKGDSHFESVCEATTAFGSQIELAAPLRSW
jgi:hypothetical protein